MDLRCGSGKMHAVLDLETHTFETTCDKRGCGKEPEIIVIHTWDAASGALLNTRRFQRPHATTQRKE